MYQRSMNDMLDVFLDDFLDDFMHDFLDDDFDVFWGDGFDVSDLLREEDFDLGTKRDRRKRRRQQRQNQANRAQQSRSQQRNQSSNSSVSRPSQLQPPGDCSAEIHQSLQRRVKAKCNLVRTCDNVTGNCRKMQQRRRINQQCINARQAINNRCYRGGDAGHQKAVREASNAANNCTASLRANNC
jgi:hypothetical protein